MQPFLGSWDALEEGSCDLRRAKQPLSTASSAAKAWGSHHPRHPRRQPSTAGGVGAQGAGWGMSAAHRISPPLQRWWRGWRWRRRWRTVEAAAAAAAAVAASAVTAAAAAAATPRLVGSGCGRWQAGGRRAAAAAKRTPARARAGWGSGSERALKRAPSGPMVRREGGLAARLQCTGSVAAARPEAGAGSGSLAPARRSGTTRGPAGHAPAGGRSPMG